MINLLPDSEKNSLRKEYHLRIVALTLLGLLIVSGIAVILLIPPYILTLYKSSVAENFSTKPLVADSDQSDFIEKLSIAKNVATALKPDKPTLEPTEIITYISQKKPQTIHVTSISYNRTTKNVISISVRGIADTRQSLVDFRAILQSEPHVASVDLPVSSFAQDTQIPFDISITTK